jgi:hypothetical protein
VSTREPSPYKKDLASGPVRSLQADGSVYGPRLSIKLGDGQVPNSWRERSFNEGVRVGEMQPKNCTRQ